MAKCFQSSCTDEQDCLDNIWIASNSTLSKLHGQCNTGSVNPHCFNYFKKNAFFFPALLHCRSRTDLSPCAALILHSHLHDQQSPACLQSCCSPWSVCGARQHRGAAGSCPHCVGQGDRRKAVLSGAAAWFSFDSFIFIAFNNFLCFVTNKSPCQGPHSLPGITAGCLVSPLCVTTWDCRDAFCLFRFVCVTELTQSLWGFWVSPSKYTHVRAQCLGPGPWSSCSHWHWWSCFHL